MSGLLRHVVSFAAVLRQAEIPVTTTQIAQFVQALGHVDLGDVGLVREAGRATLTASRDESARFDALFDRHWRAGVSTPAAAAAPPPLPPPLRPAEVALAGRMGRPEDGAPDPLSDRSSTWSATERLRRKRFDQLTADELVAVRALFRTEAWPFVERRTRRFRAAARGDTLDWRRTLRAAIRHEGELLVRRWRLKRQAPRPLVVLADISGSMERYSRVLLTFVHAVVQRTRRQPRTRGLEVFVFGTRLTRITRALTLRSVDEALSAVTAHVPDWSGGTRIGDALHTFNRRWARRILTRAPIVLVISDGWDQGDPERIATEMRRLRRSSHRLLWLHPLAGGPGFEPRTRGLIAALPAIDALLPAGTLDELAAVGASLAGAGRDAGVSRRPPAST